MKVSDFIVQRLSEWQVKRTFGYPGDGINGILGALNRNGDIWFIQSRHEEMAAFMACTHAKFTESSVFVWQLPARVLFICLTDYMTQNLTSSQLLRSSGNRSAPHWEVIISRK